MVTTNSKILLLSLTLLLLSGIINTFNKKPFFTFSKQNSAININNFALNAFSLGQQRLISSFLWITTLIESDTEHYKKRDLSSWMYLRFNSITLLDPKFLEAYQFGGKYLNIVKDDLIGSQKIFESGLRHYPNNYDLLFNYAFLMAFEIQDYEKAILAYNKVIEFPQAPEYIKSLILKLKYENSTNPQLVLTLLKELYNKEPDGTYLKEKLEQDILSLQTQVDLNCLNNPKVNLEKCNKISPTGKLYIKTDNKFISPDRFKEYKFHKR